MVEISQHFLSPALLDVWSFILTGGSAAFDSPDLWLKAFWVFALVMEVVEVPLLRTLLILGVISVIFFILFLTDLSKAVLRD